MLSKDNFLKAMRLYEEREELESLLRQFNSEHIPGTVIVVGKYGPGNFRTDKEAIIRFDEHHNDIVNEVNNLIKKRLREKIKDVEKSLDSYVQMFWWES